ncbi:aromatic amino acid ammonia-lyase [Paracoccus pacificus]|uniref:Aromatic amino acid ammonia-lyase n=1 Tax=Paracoccus pacificus TaxID=1463598 RepID=A0ABW4R6P8_9RHOB
MKRPAITLDSAPLGVAQMRAIAAGQLSVEIPPTALERVQAGRNVFDAVIGSGQPVYGSTTGVGALKDSSVPQAERPEFSLALAHAHQVAVGPELPEGVVRLAVAIRLNTALSGRVGCSTDFVSTLGAMLNHDLLPVMHSLGSVGCGDLGQMGELATVMTGQGQARLKGRALPAAQALAQAGIQPLAMSTRDALAAVASNASGIARSALAVAKGGRAIRRLMATGAASAQSMSLIRETWEAAADLGGAAEQLMAEWLVSALPDDGRWPVTIRVHDPLSARMLVQILAACIPPAVEAAQSVSDATARVDDNPVILRDKVVPSGGSLHIGLSQRLSTMQVALAHLARNIFNRCLLLTNGQLRGLPINLVPPGSVATGYGPMMKLALEQSVRVTALSPPVSVLNQTLAAGLEDEAVFLSLTAERMEAQAEALEWLSTIEAVLAAQALDLTRDKPVGVAALVYEQVREFVPFLEHDFPHSQGLMQLNAAMATDRWLKTIVKAAPLFPFDPVLGLN